jgi:hypothetical protein
MACTCTEDIVDVGGGVIVGYNKVTCSECIANNEAQAANNRKHAITAELAQIDLKSMRVVRDITLGLGSSSIVVGGIAYTNSTYLVKLEDDAATLRAEYATL